MSYRLRLFSGDRLLLATDHATTREAGRALGEFPLDEVIEGKAGATGVEVRWETTHRDASGQRPATAEEEDEVFEAMVKRHAEVTVEQMPECQRCGRKGVDHLDRYPLRTTLEGPIYYDCWTQEERDRLLPSDWPR
ncbi:MAG: hypothetical protein ACRDMH_16060 [Solirubrobacterales bacterium]